MKEINFELKLPALFFAPKAKWNIKAVLSGVLTLSALIFGRSNGFSFFEMLVLIYFIIALIWNISSRISASLALFCLICCPILLILKKDSLAEVFAIFAYYFLVITVIQEIFELKKAKKVTPNLPVDNFPRQTKRKVV